MYHLLQKTFKGCEFANINRALGEHNHFDMILSFQFKNSVATVPRFTVECSHYKSNNIHVELMCSRIVCFWCANKSPGDLVKGQILIQQAGDSVCQRSFQLMLIFLVCGRYFEKQDSSKNKTKQMPDGIQKQDMDYGFCYTMSVYLQSIKTKTQEKLESKWQASNIIKSTTAFTDICK